MAPQPNRIPVAKVDRSTLDKLLIRAVAWTAAARWGSQLVSSGALLVNARLLSPADFGVVSITVLLMGFINLLAEFGLGSAIVVMRELSGYQVRQTHVLSILLGFASSGVACLAARPGAIFFHKPELMSVLPALSLGFIITGFRVVPQALLARDLRFKAISAIEAVAVLANAVVTVLFAWWGWRYWALVLGSLAGSTVNTALCGAVSPCGFAKPVFRQVRNQLAYSQRLLISRAAWYLYSNSDFTVAGRVLGEAALGVYTMAWNLANAPVERVVTLVLRATPSIFSQVQDDAVELRRYLRLVTEAMSLAVFPAAFGLALVAGPAVSALLDARWVGVATPVRLLAIAAVFRCLSSVVSQVQTTIRDVKYSMTISLIGLCVYPPSFWYASRWGGDGIAAVWVCLSPLLNTLVLFRTLSRIGMSKRQYFESIKPAAVATAAMTGVVLGVHGSLHGVRPLIELAMECIIGVAVYSGVLVVFFRPRVNAFLALTLRQKTRGNN